MNEIIPGLYIGDWQDANNIENLKQHKIRRVINISELSIAYPELCKYLHIDITDDEDVNITQYFNKTSKFIYTALLRKQAVLVHCVAGRSRSPTIVIAFLMKKHKMTLTDAIRLVQSKRQTSPNMGFLRQLQKYETYLQNLRNT